MLDAKFYTPSNWYWIVGGNTSRAWSSAAGVWAGEWPADRVTRIANETELCNVLRGYGLKLPAPSAADVTAEYQRRLVLLLGATDIGHAGFIHADDAREAAALAAIASPTDEQLTRLTELEDRAHAVATLIDKYNKLPEPPPADYTADAYWT